ncbi:MAG: hypothetical protein AAGH89_03330 [Verrucomicrobiota bacterium]
MIAQVGIFLLLPENLEAHQIKAVAAKASFERDGSYTFGLSLEIQASEDPLLNDAISPEQAAMEYLRNAVTLHFDSDEVVPEFSPLEPLEQENPLPGMDVITQLYTETSSSVPAEAGKFMVRLSEETDVALVMVVIIDGVLQKRAHTLFAGEFSRPVDLGFVGSEMVKGDPFVEEDAAGELEPSLLDHLLPGAQLLFSNDAKRAVLALAIFLLATGFFRGFSQVLALVLGLVFGQMLALVGSVPEWAYMGELVLGGTIILMAWSNLAQTKVTSIRFALVVLVGMLLGFCTQPEISGSLQQLQGFLLGEIAALFAVFFVTWIVLGAFWKKNWYRSLLVVPASWILLGMGLFWTGMTLWEAGLLAWVENLR